MGPWAPVCPALALESDSTGIDLGTWAGAQLPDPHPAGLGGSASSHLDPRCLWGPAAALTAEPSVPSVPRKVSWSIIEAMLLEGSPGYPSGSVSCPGDSPLGQHHIQRLGGYGRSQVPLSGSSVSGVHRDSPPPRPTHPPFAMKSVLQCPHPKVQADVRLKSLTGTPPAGCRGVPPPSLQVLPGSPLHPAHPAHDRWRVSLRETRTLASPPPTHSVSVPCAVELFVSAFSRVGFLPV